MYNYSAILSYRDKNDTEYRKELLECFNMTEYTDEINKKIGELYIVVKEYYTDIINLIRDNNPFALMTALDEPACFTLLFSWEYFVENHHLLVEIHNKTNKIGEKRKILINKINSQIK